MEFVVFILKAIFHHADETAYHIMMHVHTRGIGIAGLFPYETAEAKVFGQGEVEAEGPAIFELPGATLVVPPGWSAKAGPDAVVLEKDA